MPRDRGARRARGRPARARDQEAAGIVVHHVGFYADDVVELDGLRVLALARVTSDLLCTARSSDALASLTNCCVAPGRSTRSCGSGSRRRSAASRIRGAPCPARGSSRWRHHARRPRAGCAAHCWNPGSPCRRGTGLVVRGVRVVTPCRDGQLALSRWPTREVGSVALAARAAAQGLDVVVRGAGLPRPRRRARPGTARWGGRPRRRRARRSRPARRPRACGPAGAASCAGPARRLPSGRAGRASWSVTS